MRKTERMRIRHALGECLDRPAAPADRIRGREPAELHMKKRRHAYAVLIFEKSE
jgi:hypothetical protein